MQNMLHTATRLCFLIDNGHCIITYPVFLQVQESFNWINCDVGTHYAKNYANKKLP